MVRASLLLPFLVSVDGTAVPPPPAPAAETTITALHHNPHWECMADSSCQSAAYEQFNGFLKTYDIDFASLVMGGADYAPSDSRWKFTTSTSGKDKDTATLVWDEEKWELLDSKATEFEENRAAMLGLLRSKNDPTLKLVVGALHYSHGDAPVAAVGKIITSLWGKEKVGRVLFLGDTNVVAKDIVVQHDGEELHLNGTTSEELVAQYGIPSWSVSTTDALPTCCGDWEANTPGMPYVLTFDRIFTNFDCRLDLLEDVKYREMTEGYVKTPSWAEAVKKPSSNTTAAYHHPVMARMTLSAGEVLV